MTLGLNNQPYKFQRNWMLINSRDISIYIYFLARCENFTQFDNMTVQILYCIGTFNKLVIDPAKAEDKGSCRCVAEGFGTMDDDNEITIGQGGIFNLLGNSDGLYI